MISEGAGVGAVEEGQEAEETGLTRGLSELGREGTSCRAVRVGV